MNGVERILVRGRESVLLVDEGEYTSCKEQASPIVGIVVFALRVKAVFMNIAQRVDEALVAQVKAYMTDTLLASLRAGGLRNHLFPVVGPCGTFGMHLWG